MIMWPKAQDKKSWKLLDDELDIILEAAMQGPVNRKLQTLTTIVYSVTKTMFGVEKDKVHRKPPKPNRRQSRIENLIREVRQLKRRYRQSSPTERAGPSQLRDIVLTQMKLLRKAETRGQRRGREPKRDWLSQPTNTSLRETYWTKSGQANSKSQYKRLNDIHSLGDTF